MMNLPIFRFRSFATALVLMTASFLHSVSLAQSAAPPPPAGEAQAQLQKVRIKAGMFIVLAELAKEPAQRSMGLMHRKTMEADHGMLFVFDRVDGHCFWMRNTPLPLSIAWIAEDGTIVTISDMQPFSEQNHCPTAPAKYALEMNQGWFKKKGIKAGTKLSASGLFGG